MMWIFLGCREQGIGVINLQLCLCHFDVVYSHNSQERIVYIKEQKTLTTTYVCVCVSAVCVDVTVCVSVTMCSVYLCVWCVLTRIIQC